MNFLFKSKFDISTILLYVIGFLGCLFTGIYFSFIENYDTAPLRPKSIYFIINHISLVYTRQP